MACGVPVVATDVGDVRPIVGEVGEVAPPRDPEQLCASWARLRLRLAQDPGLGEASRRFIIATYGVDAMVRRTESVLALLAAGRSPEHIAREFARLGGHCIGVDPYYLTHRAESYGYHPEVLLAGRRINDGVGLRVARECLRTLLRKGGNPRLVTVLGLTFKENARDIRNSRSFDIVRELQSFGVEVQAHDPLALPDEVMEEYELALAPESTLAPADAVILAVPHDYYLNDGWSRVRRLLNNGRGLLMDLKAKLDRNEKPDGIELWRL